jgi:hypothetical protein
MSKEKTGRSGVPAQEATHLAETDLTARLMRGEATQVVRDKMLFLIRLFKEAGDALYALLEAAPDNLEVVDWGITFYERLQGRSDDALVAGNLPRSELDAGLAELKARKAACRRGPLPTAMRFPLGLKACAWTCPAAWSRAEGRAPAEGEGVQGAEVRAAIEGPAALVFGDHTEVHRHEILFAIDNTHAIYRM